MTDDLTRLSAAELAAELGPQGGLERRGHPGPARPHRRRRRRHSRLPARRRRGRAGDGRRHRRPPRRRRGPPRPGRRPDRGQGHRRDQGHAHDVRLQDPRRLDPALRRHDHPAHQGRRPADPRQDQHGRVRDGLVDRALGVRTHPQPLGPHPHPRWLRRWLGRCRRRIRGTAGHRHRHRRLDPPARRADRHGRRQADLRRRQPLRPRGARQQPRPGRPVTRTVLDAALLHELMGGHDPMDSTSIDAPAPLVVAAARRADVKGLKIGIVKELGGEGFQAGVSARFNEAVELLTSRQVPRSSRCRCRASSTPSRPTTS